MHEAALISEWWAQTRDVFAEDKARMVQPEDCGDIIAFLARLPPHVCINELTVSPTWNRGYVGQARALKR